MVIKSPSPRSTELDAAGYGRCGGFLGVSSDDNGDAEHPPRACSTPQPAPLARRQTSNYISALRKHSSKDLSEIISRVKRHWETGGSAEASSAVADASASSTKDSAGDADTRQNTRPDMAVASNNGVDPLDKTAHGVAATQETSETSYQRSSPSFVQATVQPHYSPEDTKRLMQRKSIDLDAAASEEQFGIKYGGLRRSSLDDDEDDEGLQKFKAYHDAAIEELRRRTLQEEDDNKSCFHSNQLNEKIQDAESAGYFPQSFEYNDFKRRMSYHNRND